MSSLNHNLRTADVEGSQEAPSPRLPALGGLRAEPGRGAARRAAAAVTPAACSSFGGLTGNDAPPAPASASSTTASSSTSFASRVKALFAGDLTTPPSPAPQPANSPAADIECPSVEF